MFNSFNTKAEALITTIYQLPLQPNLHGVFWKKHKKLTKKVKEERRIVAITTLWKVVRKTQEATENQISKCYD